MSKRLQLLSGAGWIVLTQIDNYRSTARPVRAGLVGKTVASVRNPSGSKIPCITWEQRPPRWPSCTISLGDKSTAGLGQDEQGRGQEHQATGKGSRVNEIGCWE